MGLVSTLVFFQAEQMYVLHGGVLWERSMSGKVERKGLKWCGNTSVIWRKMGVKLVGEKR